MLLTVDVGNTHIRLGVFPVDGGPLERTWSMRTSPAVTSDELALTIRGLLGECAGRLSGISAMSVVPSVTGELRRMAADYWPDLRAVVVAPGVKTGVPLLVDNPREVGSDRVVNALAAHTLFEGAVIVVDVDTATTVDAVSERGELLGGAIAPGIDISVDALAERAAALRKIEVVRPRGALGKNTVAALQAGIVIGFAGQIDALVDRLRSDVAELADAAVVLTGLRADVVAEESRTITDVEPELALEGLRLVFEKNT
ncbi:type III pantothenate kinase [Dietzia psychralcaliphila]|uniref:Type III pantothenate kinase n=1 Tax=Dietzia psychralcaliphila TaxID=139021 RepID=A0AAD0JS66_9ACTN|nr:type III pantothenate kinase [Dietzia psychralcaliphila]AWH94598.1 pantothenate kinase [Dietzia psychralcaliphila]PTM86114.1 type III pantothenate kinase [Dietzia psychralcaliphila]